MEHEDPGAGGLLVPPDGRLETPVAFIVFNRPQLTVETFAAIRSVRPAQLFVIADGPRSGHKTDEERVAEVRSIVSKVDWPCDVRTDFAGRNLGCKSRVSSGLDWVFSQVDRAIVLEDDCVPSPDFFWFCAALLDRYADDPRVAAVTGNNFQDGNRRTEASYYFSKYLHVWGWATWRRVWNAYDGDITFWPDWRSSEDWRQVAGDRIERRFWERIFDRVAEIDTWDFPFVASTWRLGGLVVTPVVNLVSNIGFGPDAAHTTDTASPLAGMPVQPLGPLIHPDDVIRDADADAYAFDHVFGGSSLRRRRTPLGFLGWVTRSLWRLARTLVSPQRGRR